MRILVAAAALLIAAGDAGASQRMALIVGNGGYENVSPLTNPPNDARLMASVLEKAGFDVELLVDADQTEMKAGIVRFGRKLRAFGRDAIGLFYYAGHGVQSHGKNYLVPVGTDIIDEADLDVFGVDAGWVLRQMESAENATNIVILDACRNNPFKSQFRSADRGLARIEAPTGSFVAYATAPGDTASDGDSANSPYTAALANHIAQPGLPIENVFKQVRIDVLEQTAGRQTPWDSSSLVEDFYFVPPSGDSGTAAPEPVASVSDAPIHDAALTPGADEAAPVHDAAAMDDAAPSPTGAAEATEPEPSPDTAATGSRGDPLESLLWQQVLATGNLLKLDAFLRLYPESGYRGEAEALRTILAPGGGSSAVSDGADSPEADGTVVAALSPDTPPAAPAATDEKAEPAPPPELTVEEATDIETALELSRSERREIQRRLTLLGFSTRGVDGIFGDGTRAAISGWQEKNELQPTGYLNTEQIGLLETQSSSKYAAYLKEQRARGNARGSSVRRRGGARYIDTRGCLREADGRYVPFFKRGCG